MDDTNQWKTMPSADDDIDAVAKRLSVNWAGSVTDARRAGGQVLQRLKHGRVHVVAVESKRSRLRPGGARA